MDRGDIAEGLFQRGLVKLTLFGQGNRVEQDWRTYIKTREGGSKQEERNKTK